MGTCYVTRLLLPCNAIDYIIPVEKRIEKKKTLHKHSISVKHQLYNRHRVISETTNKTQPSDPNLRCPTFILF